MTPSPTIPIKKPTPTKPPGKQLTSHLSGLLTIKSDQDAQIAKGSHHLALSGTARFQTTFFSF